MTATRKRFTKCTMLHRQSVLSFLTSLGGDVLGMGDACEFGQIGCDDRGHAMTLSARVKLCSPLESIDGS